MKNRYANRAAAVAASALLALLAGCQDDDRYAKESVSATANRTRTAVAHLDPTQGNRASGTVTFVQEEGGIRVIANITGLKPGEHGFHIHEKGDCSAPDASSAGGHFNPTNDPHADHGAERRHVGDFGNITATSAGVAHKEFLDKKLSFDGPNSIVGKGVIVHADPDDLTSQPSGNAGARVACGVIEMDEDPPQ